MIIQLTNKENEVTEKEISESWFVDIKNAVNGGYLLQNHEDGYFVDGANYRAIEVVE